MPESEPNQNQNLDPEPRPESDGHSARLNISSTYQLKAIALLRLLSEVALWVILVGIPPGLLLFGKMQTLPFAGKIVFSATAVIALVLLPVYGFITFQVRTDQHGITTCAVFVKNFCAWENVKSLSRRSTWNWLRYVVEYEGGELSFPVLLKNCDVLVDEIRNHLPTGAPSHNPFRVFRIDSTAMILQVLQAVYGLIFIAITWSFFAALTHSKTSNWSDSSIIFAFCLATTGILCWRTFMVLMMPRSVQVKPDALILSTYFFERNLPWNTIVAVSQPSPFLPEGFILKTKSGSFLVGSHINSADELQETIKQHVPKENEKR